MYWFSFWQFLAASQKHISTSTFVSLEITKSGSQTKSQSTNDMKDNIFNDLLMASY